MSHVHHGVVCEHATKAACDRLVREALGKCTELTLAKEPTACRLWATGLVAGRSMCNDHARAFLERQISARQKAQRQAELQAVIDTYRAWVKEHPSVWDALR